MTTNQCRSLNLVLGVLTAMGIILVTSGGSAQGPPKVAALPEFAEAEAVLKSLDEVCPKLLRIIVDEKRPKSVRAHAARWLGKLRYVPAIPALIQNVELIDPDGPAEDGPDFPCRDALQMFGDAAVPALVDAFMAVTGRGQDRENCLYMAITQKSRSTARTYAQGLAVQNTDAKFQKRIDYFLDKIKPR